MKFAIIPLAVLSLFLGRLTADDTRTKRSPEPQPSSPAAASPVDTSVNTVVTKPAAQDVKDDVWSPTLDQAERLARDTHRPIFLFINPDWSEPGRQMKQRLNDSAVQSLLKKNFVSFCADDSNAEATYQRFNVTRFPTVVFLDSDSSELDRFVGARTTNELLSDLHNVIGKFSAKHAQTEYSEYRDHSFLHYLPPADPAFAAAMQQLSKDNVKVAWDVPGEPAEDQMRIELKIDHTKDWQSKSLEMLKGVSKLAKRPIALSWAWAEPNEDTTPVLTFGSYTPHADAQTIRSQLSQHGEIRIARTPAALARLADQNATRRDSAVDSNDQQKVRLVIVGDGNATSKEDLEKLNNLVEEGVVKRIEPSEYRPQDVAALTLQPKLPRSAATESVVGFSDGGFGPAFPAKSGTTPVAPRWDEAVRELAKASINAEIRLALFSPKAAVWPHEQLLYDVDARLLSPPDDADAIARVVKDALQKHGLAVTAQQYHPTFGGVEVPEGKRLFAIFEEPPKVSLNVAPTPNDHVDVRYTPERSLGSFPARTKLTILERMRMVVTSSPRRVEGGAQLLVVGILVSAEEADLLSKAERHGELRAFRRDPKDTTLRVAPNLWTQLRAGLEQADRPADPAAVPNNPLATRESTPTPNYKVFQLQNANAAELATLLTQIIRSPGFTAAAESRTNSIVVTSTDSEAMDLTEALLTKLDAAGSAKIQDPNRAGSPSPYRPAAVHSVPTPAAARPIGELSTTYRDSEAAARRIASTLRQQPDAGDPAADARLKSLRLELKTAVQRSFEARQKLLTAELDALQARIAETRSAIDLRTRAATEIVDQRVSQLLSSEADLSVTPLAEQRPRPTPAGELGSPIGLPGPPSLAPSTPAPPSYFQSRSSQAPAPVVPSVPGSIQPAMTPADAFRQSRTPASIRPVDELLKGPVKSLSNPMAELTGIWESHDGMEMMGMGSGYGGDAMAGMSGAGMSGSPPPRLVIDGDCAALYEKNKRQRLWTITVGQPDQAWMQVTFTPLDGQSGMQGSYVFRDSSLTVVSTSDAGAKIVRYHRSIAAVPPDWAKQMQEDARKKRKATAADPLAAPDYIPDEFRSRPRVDVSAAPSSGEPDVLSKLAGIWATTGQSGMGMGMGGNFTAMADGYGDIGRRQQAFLVIDADRAALYEKNELKRLWMISIDQTDETQTRLNFIAQDGQAGMQGAYTLKGGSLSVVSAGEEGPKIVQYRRTVPVIPPEWATEMEKAKPAAGLNEPQSDLLRGITGGSLKPKDISSTSSLPTSPRQSSPRQPSDYLEMLDKYRAALAEYNTLLETVGEGHPKARKLQRERAHEFQAIDVIQKEFQAELEEAARAVKLNKLHLSLLRDELVGFRKRFEQNGVPASALRILESEIQSAEATLQSSEAQLKLFESTRDSLFPPSIDAGPKSPGQTDPKTPPPSPMLPEVADPNSTPKRKANEP